MCSGEGTNSAQRFPLLNLRSSWSLSALSFLGSVCFYNRFAREPKGEGGSLYREVFFLLLKLPSLAKRL